MTTAVLEIDEGKVSDPVRSGSGYHIVQVLERSTTSAPPLEEIRSQVVAEFRRRGGEDAFRSYLDDRGRADIERAASSRKAPHRAVALLALSLTAGRAGPRPDDILLDLDGAGRERWTSPRAGPARRLAPALGGRRSPKQTSLSICATV